MNETNQKSAALGFALAALVLLFPNASAAQDSWGSETPTTEPRSESRSQQGTRVFDENSFRGYNDYRGPYAQFGITVGEIEFDGGIDVDAGGGVTMTGGYRAFSWVAAEFNFSYLGGGDAEVGPFNLGEAEYFSFTLGPKLFPMALFGEDQPIPEYLQPYALIGIGGGEYDIDNSGFNEKSSFIARFMFGMDVWITDHIGAFIEGGYHVADDDDVDGTGIFAFGGQYRF